MSIDSEIRAGIMMANLLVAQDIGYNLANGRPLMLLSEMQGLVSVHGDKWEDDRHPSGAWNSETCRDCGKHRRNDPTVLLRANKKTLCEPCRDKYRWPVCQECNQLCSENADNYFHIDYIAEGHCFTCWHWVGTLTGTDATDPNNRYVSVRLPDGEHYSYVKDEPMSSESDYLLGHGGRVFHIVFNDGNRVTTNNLWSQGQMSKHWLRKYPANAKSVESQMFKRMLENGGSK